MAGGGYELIAAAQWCTRVMRSKIEPIKKVVASLRRHEPLLLNWYQGTRHDLSRRRRRDEQQGQTHHEKIVRFSQPTNRPARSVPQPWGSSSTRIRPQI